MNKKMKNKLRINPIALGLSLGTLSGISILIIGLIGYFMIPEGALIASMGSWHMEYKQSLWGVCLGAIIGLVNAFIGGALIACLYNLFLPEVYEAE